MTSSLTITFSGTTPVLQATFMPEIELDADCSYSCAFLDLIIHEPIQDKGQTATTDGAGTQKKMHLDGIKNLDTITIKCDLISEYYINGVQSRIIHQFAPCASRTSAQTLVEFPKHINYIPINTKNLGTIHISFTDNKGNPIVLSDGSILCRINIKRDIN